MPEPAPKPSSLVHTIYGAFVRRLGGWIPIADLIVLMGELGVDSQTVRSTVSRLKKRGDLVQERRNSTGYRLSPEMLPVYQEGDRRIFMTLEPARLEDGWVMAVFSVPESERAHRHQLRSRLAWLGFGTIAPGVWIAPARMLDDAYNTLDRAGLSEYVHLFTTRYAAYADLHAAVGSWWDFAAIEERYAGFIVGYADVARRLEMQPAIDDVQAFRDYVPMLTRWRRLPYLDPGLPAELLPDDWNAIEARRIFVTLQDLLVRPSLNYVQKVTGLAVQADDTSPTPVGSPLPR
ncbi:MAG TPA: PaaX family transcriptional regulator C-terminal domain-containing protein [Spirillospora sp.]|nr:PaaX family transcriptional regulator C-terminal domain-containing protein [Spirillospora sp.]